jgi:hypothetical protein
LRLPNKGPPTRIRFMVESLFCSKVARTNSKIRNGEENEKDVGFSWLVLGKFHNLPEEDGRKLYKTRILTQSKTID